MTMSILFLWRRDLVIVTYNVWSKPLNVLPDYTGTVRYLGSAWIYLLFLFMDKIWGKGKISLYCS